MADSLGGVKLGGVAEGSNDGTVAERIFDPGQSVRGLRGLWKEGRGGSGSSTPVGDAYAALTRDQWNTYVQNFIPIENKLIQYATDPTVVSSAMANAGAGVSAAFDSQQASTDRRLRGLGVSLDADEQRAANRSFGLAKSLADVGAQNTARDVTEQRQASILGNPSPEQVRI